MRYSGIKETSKQINWSSWGTLSVNFGSAWLVRKRGCISFAEEATFAGSRGNASMIQTNDLNCRQYQWAILLLLDDVYTIQNSIENWAQIKNNHVFIECDKHVKSNTK